MFKLATTIALTSLLLGGCASRSNESNAPLKKNQSHMSQISGGRICRADRGGNSRIKKVRCDDSLARQSRTSVNCSGDALHCAKVNERDNNR